MIAIVKSGLMTVGMVCLLAGTLSDTLWARQLDQSEAGTALAAPAADTKLFLEGFDAYQKKDYPTALHKFRSILTGYPQTPLRSLIYYWLLQSNYWSGNLQEASRYHASLIKEYPEFQLQGLLNQEQQQLFSRSLSSVATPVAVGAERPLANVSSRDQSARKQPAKSAAAHTAMVGLAVPAVVVAATAIEIRTEGPAPVFRSFRERQPERLVIDLQAAGTKIAAGSIPVKRFGIKRVRIGGHAKSVRFVLDAAGNSFPSYTITATPQGIRIDFKNAE